ncbi:hypothetical protein NF212_25310 (plasmid) [Parasalinivibrio latis]|uniref:hypothetical protein n=1 Tax=Parasalinivibrio latis TaxID=2952610 RepID=UPI0030DE2278
MKCPRCAEKIKNEAFVCRYCGSDIIPHSANVISTFTSLFSKEKFIEVEVVFSSDYEKTDIIEQMETFVSILNKAGYKIFWGWCSNSSKKCKFNAGLKGEHNVVVYSKVFKSLSNMVNNKVGDAITFSEIRIVS